MSHELDYDTGNTEEVVMESGQGGSFYIFCSKISSHAADDMLQPCICNTLKANYSNVQQHAQHLKWIPPNYYVYINGDCMNEPIKQVICAIRHERLKLSRRWGTGIHVETYPITSSASKRRTSRLIHFEIDFFIISFILFSHVCSFTLLLKVAAVLLSGL